MWMVVLLVSTTCWFGCKKATNDVCGYTNADLQSEIAPASEVAALQQFIERDSIDAVKDPRGFYYKIETPGSADKLEPCASIAINYVGTLTNGKIFDQAENAQFNISSLIAGWQVGLPLIGKGGKITLYLPPSFGYGSGEINGIPANSILIFSIDLINFNNP